MTVLNLRFAALLLLSFSFARAQQPILRGSDGAWANWRLGQNYYQEGALVWLETDMKIRQLTRGKKSLDDFASYFFGATTPATDKQPGVLTYNFADVVAALNATAPYDWSAFWTTRLNTLTPKPPTAGLEAAGYDYVDAETMVPDEAAYMDQSHSLELFHSMGIFVMPDGTLRDVWVHNLAYDAGLGPGDKLTKVNGQPYSADALKKAIREAKSSAAPIIFIAERDGESASYSINYHGGEKYANLKRNANPDVLTTVILQPRR
jgi:predicted metalloprotease with PDZ domain